MSDLLDLRHSNENVQFYTGDLFLKFQLPCNLNLRKMICTHFCTHLHRQTRTHSCTHARAAHIETRVTTIGKMWIADFPKHTGSEQCLGKSAIQILPGSEQL